MTTAQPDRLDRIEQILEGLATSQQQTDQRIAAVAEQQELTQRQLELTRSIADSNARAIGAWGERINDIQQEHEQTDSRSELLGYENSQQIAALIAESRENIRQHEEFRARFARLEGDSNGNGGSQEGGDRP